MKRDPKPSRERAGCARGVRNWSDVKFHKRSSRMGRKVERCHWTLGDSLISNLGSYTRPVKLEDRTKTLKHASSPNIFLYIPRLFVRKLLQDAFHQNKGGNQKGLQQAGAQQRDRGGGIPRMTAKEVVRDDNGAAGLGNDQCRWKARGLEQRGPSKKSVDLRDDQCFSTVTSNWVGT